MKTITPKNWGDFQHYKDRKPAWIKLHRDLLDNYDFHCLPLASKALAPCLWLLASEYEGGNIPADWRLIAFRLRMTPQEVEEAVTPLISSGFFIASEPLADCKQSACLEKERETETETETERERASARVPAEPPEAQEPQQAKSPRPSRKCPADFALTDELRQWAAAECPGVSVDAETAKFMDHTFGTARTDWVGTWRNWIRKAGERLPKGAQPGRHDLSRMNYGKGVSADGAF